MKGKPTAYPCHDVKCRLSDGTVILWNCIQGYSTEDHASMCLRPLTEREAAEVAQIEADDDAEAAAADRHDDLGKEAGR